MRHQKVRANAKATTIKTCSDSKMQIGQRAEKGKKISEERQQDPGRTQDSLGPSTKPGNEKKSLHKENSRLEGKVMNGK